MNDADAVSDYVETSEKLLRVRRGLPDSPWHKQYWESTYDRGYEYRGLRCATPAVSPASDREHSDGFSPIRCLVRLQT